MKLSYINAATFDDVRRHSDKLIKLLTLSSKSNLLIIPKKLMVVNSSSSPVEVLEAFNADLNKTIVTFSDAHKLLSTVDENHMVTKLENEEKDLRVLFGDSYDPVLRTIDFGAIQLSMRSEFSADYVREMLLKTYLDTSEATYAALFKNRNKMHTLSGGELITNDEKVEYLATSPISKKILSNVVDSFSDYQLSYPEQERRYIADITERAGVESVMKTSTYITATEGIKQLAPRHKKEAVLIESLLKQVIEGNPVKALEIDHRADLKSVLNALIKLDEVSINLGDHQPQDARLSFRLLGNHKALGLYFSQMNLVGVDFSKPGGVALIHEYTHAIDINNPEIANSDTRREMASFLGGRLDPSGLDESYGRKRAHYYLNSKEVMARGGEIGFLLMQYDYQGESISEFVERVNAKESELSDPYNIRLIKPIQSYIDNPDIYFDIQSMTPDELLGVREYYSTHFGVRGIKPKPVNEVKIDMLARKHKVVINNPVLGEISDEVKKKSVKVFKPLKGLSPWTTDNTASALELNDKESVITAGELVHTAFTGSTHISRTTNKYTQTILKEQKSVVGMITDYAHKNITPEVAYMAAKALFENGSYFGNEVIDYKAVKVRLELALGLKVNMDEAEIYSGLITKMDELDIKRDEIFSLIDEDSEYPVRADHPRWDEAKGIHDDYYELKSNLNSTFPTMLRSVVNDREFIPTRSDYWFHSLEKVPKRDEHRALSLDSTYVKALCKPMVEATAKYIQSVDPKALALMFSTPDSIPTLIALTSDSSMRSALVGDNVELDKALMEQYVNLDLAGKAIENESSFIHQGGFDKRFTSYKRGQDYTTTFIERKECNALDIIPDTMTKSDLLAAVERGKDVVDLPLVPTDSVEVEAIEAGAEVTDTVTNSTDGGEWVDKLIGAVEEVRKKVTKPPKKAQTVLSKANQQSFNF